MGDFADSSGARRSEFPAQPRGSEYVTELRDDDVLFGRGSGPNDHEGNIRFRQYVAARKAEYLATNHRLTKAKIAREIVEIVFSRQGRFLKKMEAEDLRRAGLSESIDAWTGVDDDTIMEKAKQALRQNTNKKSGSGSSVSSPSPVSSAPVVQQQRLQQPQLQQSYHQQMQHHHPQQYEPHPLNHGGPLPSTVPYALDDLEPIPLEPSSSDPSPTHVQRPSQIAMPPPAISRTEWQLQQRQQLAQQRLSVDPQSYAGGMEVGVGQQSTNDQDAYQDSDNMMAYVPSGMMQQQQPPQQRLPNRHAIPSLNNNVSLSSLPQSDEPLRNSLRSSLVSTGIDTSMDMSQLMSSFQSTRISDDDGRNKLMASTETMGTIEPIAIGGGESVADMSIATLNSSTFSILKGDDSTLGLGAPVTTPPAAYGRMPSGGSSILGSGSLSSSIVKQGGTSDSSLSFYELTSSGRSNPGSGNKRASANSTSLEGVKEEDTEPLPVGLSSSLGSSSLSMLKGMVMSSEDVLQPSNNAGYEQEQQYQNHGQQQRQQRQQQYSSSEEQVLPYPRG